MLHYHPQIAILTGLEWDHMNVSPTLASYEAAFSSFIRSMPTGSVLLFDSDDPALTRLVLGERHPDARPYKAFEADYKDDRSVIQAEGRAFEMGIFGKHNFSNLKAAALVAREIGIPESDFLAAMSDFKGAQKRMQIVHQSDELIIIQDFAHAPSKVRATALAVKERYPDHSLTAVLELHTFSSLNPEFLPEYKGSLDPAEERLVMYVPGSSDHKKLPRLADSDIRRAFNDDGLQIAHDRDELTDMIKKKEGIKQVILLMSSGYWGGGNFEDLLSKLRAD